jgi:dTDP-glucose pyrophosphorylase
MREENYPDKKTAVRRALCHLPEGQHEEAAKHLIGERESVADALRMLNAPRLHPLVLFSVDDRGRISGSITDGDIRRSLLRGVLPESPITDALHRDFTAIRPGDDSMHTLREAKERMLSLIPKIDEEGYAIDFVDPQRIHTILPLDALLMAGGRGERLLPLTLDTPKPLLKVGGKAIIDYNVEKLLGCGVNSIFVAVNYLHEQIEEHFRDNHPGADVRCVVEPSRMGTLGAASLIKEWRHEDVVVMNADLLSDLDLEEMYLHHRATDADATMAVTPYSVSVPYAIVTTEEDRVVGMQEKPVYNYFANAGVYIIKRRLVERVPEHRFTDAPQFLIDAMARGAKVAHYPIRGSWIDIGTPEEYRRACMTVK